MLNRTLDDLLPTFRVLYTFEMPILPPEQEMAKLARWRRYLLYTLSLMALDFLLMAIFGDYLRQFHADSIFYAIWGVGMFVGMFLYIGVMIFVCPNCKKSFCMSGWFSKSPFTRTCLHCGYSLKNGPKIESGKEPPNP